MTPGFIHFDWQDIVIGVLVLASFLTMVRKLAPAFVSRVQSRTAMRLLQPGRARPLRALGGFLQPREAEAGGCDSGCGTCGGCSAGNPATPDEPVTKPVAFRRHGTHAR